MEREVECLIGASTLAKLEPIKLYIALAIFDGPLPADEFMDIIFNQI